MSYKRFDERLTQMQWQPQAGPSPQIVDSVIAERHPITIRGVEFTLAGAILGILIGVGLKGIYTPGAPWGPESGLTGLLVGGAAIGGGGFIAGGGCGCDAAAPGDATADAVCVDEPADDRDAAAELIGTMTSGWA